MSITFLIYMIGAFDAVVIVLMGLVSASIILLGKDAEEFFSRAVPATAILVGTSFGAGVVMAVTRWLA